MNERGGGGTVVVRTQGGDTVEMTDLLAKAKVLGIKVKNIKKVDIVRKIQIEEGSFPCFQVDMGPCGQLDCCWRKECLR